MMYLVYLGWELLTKTSDMIEAVEVWLEAGPDAGLFWERPDGTSVRVPGLRQEPVADVLAVCELVGFKPTFLCKSIYAGVEAWDASRRCITYQDGLAYTDDVTGLAGDWIDQLGEWWLSI